MPDSNAITVIARVQARPGAEAHLLERMCRLVDETLKEPGCLRYELHVSRDKPGLHIFVESWASSSALDRHATAPALSSFKAETTHLVESLSIDLLTHEAGR